MNKQALGITEFFIIVVMAFAPNVIWGTNYINILGVIKNYTYNALDFISTINYHFAILQLFICLTIFVILEISCYIAYLETEIKKLKRKNIDE